MSRNTWIIFIVICGALLGGLIWMSQGEQAKVDDVDTSAIQPASEQNGNLADRTLGNVEAKVRIIEYADFQCPGCSDASPVLKQLVTKYKDEVVLVFRHFPLSTIHPNARAASAAAEAAGLQGKFWEMHDRLFANQNDWASLSGSTRTEMFTNYAVSLGLDREKFLQDLESDSISRKINYDLALGKKDGVTGTPAIFVNGKEVTKYYKGDELSDRNTEGSNPVWSNAEAFEKHVLLPAFEEAGVEIESGSK